MKKVEKQNKENATDKDLQTDLSDNMENQDANEQFHTAENKTESAADDVGFEEEIQEGIPVDAATREQIEALQKRLNEANDKFLRLFSEFDNYRKRVTKERLELTKTASESIITALLPVLDDLERASSMSSNDEGNIGAKEGITLIYNKFNSVLRQKGVEEIASVDQEFNTDYHEAITHIKAEHKKQKGKIVEEVQKGYMLNGKVIRYARVIVAN